jgi:hypothetical protein
MPTYIYDDSFNEMGTKFQEFLRLNIQRTRTVSIDTILEKLLEVDPIVFLKFLIEKSNRVLSDIMVYVRFVK